MAVRCDACERDVPEEKIREHRYEELLDGLIYDAQHEVMGTESRMSEGHDAAGRQVIETLEEIQSDSLGDPDTFTLAEVDKTILEFEEQLQPLIRRNRSKAVQRIIELTTGSEDAWIQFRDAMIEKGFFDPSAPRGQFFCYTCKAYSVEPHHHGG